MGTYKITATINGKVREVEAEPGETLAQMLRNRLQLTGGKVSCDKGDCGVCTVIVNGKAVKSCIYPAVKADGATILTIEGLGEQKMHPLQNRFIEFAAIQCGYCTPGFIMAAKALLDENPNPTEEEVREAVAGNICRCTGYVKPIQAIMAAAEDLRGGKEDE